MVANQTTFVQKTLPNQEESNKQTYSPVTLEPQTKPRQSTE